MLTENNPDAIISVVFATSNNIPADGTSTASVTAQVTDSAGAGLSGQSVVFTATAGAIIGSPVITDNSGLATTTLTSTTAGISSVTASVNSSTGHVDITFTEAAHSPVISSLISDKDSIVNDGNDKAILTVIVSDNRTGNPVAGENITWTTSAGTIEPRTSLSNTDGLAIAALADTGDTGAAIVTASLDNGEEATCGICLENNDAGWIISSLTSDKDSIVNDGTDTATLTGTVIDHATGSIVSGAAVSWSTDSGTVSPATSATGENGLTTTQLSDTGDTGTVTVTASLKNGKAKNVTIILMSGVLRVVGARTDEGYQTLVALDEENRLPLMAQWQYEGDDVVYMGTRFSDRWPCKELTVKTSRSSEVIRPANLSLSGHSEQGSSAAAVFTDQKGPYAWGEMNNGGSMPGTLAGRTLLGLRNDTHGFACITPDTHNLQCWGSDYYNQSLPDRLKDWNNIIHIAGVDRVFAVLSLLSSSGGSVAAWGDEKMSAHIVPGDIASLTDVIRLEAGGSSFAALRQDGSAVSWGIIGTPSDTSVFRDIISITGSPEAFAALRQDGRVVAWGDNNCAVIPPEIASLTNIKSITAASTAFVALCEDGHLVGWGTGDAAIVPDNIAHAADIVCIVGGDSAFAVLRKNGSVAAWGDPSHGGRVPDAISMLTDVVSLSGCWRAAVFTAIRQDGSVVSWGNPDTGGNDASVSEISGFRAVYVDNCGFIALTDDGRVYTWGIVPANIPAEVQQSVSYSTLVIT